MPENVFIRLHTHDTSSVDYVIVDENNHTSSSQQRIPLEQLKDVVGNFPIIVLVPGIEILLTHVKVPKTSASKLLNVVRYALEDELSVDVDQCHFALGPRLANHKLSVAVVDKETMSHWHSLITHHLENKASQLKIMMADVQTLQGNEDKWQVLIEKQHALINMGEQGSYVVDKNNLNTALNLAIINRKGMGPKQIIYADVDDNNTKLTIDNVMLSKNDAFIHSANTLEAMAKQYSADKVINLLQDIYQPSTTTATIKKLWAVVGVLIAILLLILTVGYGVQYMYLSKQNSLFENQISVIYKKIFPQATTVVSPRLRIEQALKLTKSGATKQNFFTQLTVISPLISKYKQIKLLGLDYAENQIELNISATAFSDIDGLIKTLHENGYKTKQLNTTKEANRIMTKLVITGS